MNLTLHHHEHQAPKKVGVVHDTVRDSHNIRLPQWLHGPLAGLYEAGYHSTQPAWQGM